MLYMKTQINMRHIEAFRSVMLTGSMVGAAKLLNVTQPGVSRTIGLLEIRLGYSLFDRLGRRLVPTAEAEALYREVEQIYTGIERIGQVAQDIRFQRAGALRVATLPALAQWLVPKAITQFLEQRPKVSVFVQSLPSRQIAELVSTRQFDVGVIELPLTRPGIEVRPLNPVRTIAVMPGTHPLAKKKSISLKELHQERMILLSQHSYVRYQIDDAFAQLGVAPEVVIETPSSSIGCALVACGAGVALVSRWTAMPFAGPGLVVVPIKEPLYSRYAIIFPEARAKMPLAQAFAVELQSLTEVA